MACKLGGVQDESVVPMRGQLVVVANRSGGMFSRPGMEELDKSIGECCYIIERPSGGGTALGGSWHHSWSTEPDLALSDRIMRRSIELCPQLVPPGAGVEALKVIRHQVGLRPYRKGGPRVEREEIADGDDTGLRVVHNYGSGGCGFQGSYGMAARVVELVCESLGKAEEHRFGKG
ncbi:MAG: hypothetical protein M1839_006941 [Geoglossum umbratile]|nr:MAG: hypothetical protein M1839_006941 [Geoglossum umbratile]